MGHKMRLDIGCHMEIIKIFGVILSLTGTIIIAIRATRLIEQLCLAVEAHDLNFRIEAATANGEAIPNIRMYGTSTHVEKEKKFGTKLLVLGFGLQVAGGICQVIALMEFS
jgi:hypothetical protein